MYILGVNISHHASVCLLNDGEVIFYLEDDRLSKRKEIAIERDSKLLSLEKVVEYTNHIDHIIFCSFGRRLDIKENDNVIIKYILNKVGFTYDNVHFLREHHLYHAFNAFYSSGFEEGASLVLDAGGASLQGRGDDLPESKGLTEVKFLNLDLFYREGESMYYFAPNEDYKCVFKNYVTRSFGNMGMYEPARVTGWADTVSDNVFLSSSLSCGGLFNELTAALGLVGDDGNDPQAGKTQCGKTMGLSSYGNANEFTDPWFKKDEETGIWVTDNIKILKIFSLQAPRFYKFLKEIYTVKKKIEYDFDSGNEEMFQGAADLSKKLQEETKKHTIRLIQTLLDKTGTNNIVLSGGYFLNCVNNYQYVKEFPEVNFYIDPVCHDGGTAMGAARYVWHHILKNTTRHPLDTLFLG